MVRKKRRHSDQVRPRCHWCRKASCWRRNARALAGRAPMANVFIEPVRGRRPQAIAMLKIGLIYGRQPVHPCQRRGRRRHLRCLAGGDDHEDRRHRTPRRAVERSAAVGRHAGAAGVTSGLLARCRSGTRRRWCTGTARARRSRCSRLPSPAGATRGLRGVRPDLGRADHAVRDPRQHGVHAARCTCGRRGGPAGRVDVLDGVLRVALLHLHRLLANSRRDPLPDLAPSP